MYTCFLKLSKQDVALWISVGCRKGKREKALFVKSGWNSYTTDLGTSEHQLYSFYDFCLKGI